MVCKISEKQKFSLNNTYYIQLEESKWKEKLEGIETGHFILDETVAFQSSVKREQNSILIEIPRNQLIHLGKSAGDFVFLSIKTNRFRDNNF